MVTVPQGYPVLNSRSIKIEALCYNQSVSLTGWVSLWTIILLLLSISNAWLSCSLYASIYVSIAVSMHYNNNNNNNIAIIFYVYLLLLATALVAAISCQCEVLGIACSCILLLRKDISLAYAKL